LDSTWHSLYDGANHDWEDRTFRMNDRKAGKTSAPAKAPSKPAQRRPRGGKKLAGQRDPERTSASILDAAVKEFTEKGYGGARIDEIARRAGANKRSLYYYFGGKEALYLAVLEGAYVNIRSAEGQLRLAARDPEEGIRELCRFTWRYYVEHPEFLSLLNTENMMRAKHLKRSARIFKLHSPFVETLRELLERGAATGQFRSDADPVRVYITIASIGFFYLSNRWTLSTIFGRDLASEPELASWGVHMEDVVLGYLRP
jgi:AcrR family transcriptional regulator